jgi:hypothetical protein
MCKQRNTGLPFSSWHSNIERDDDLHVLVMVSISEKICEATDLTVAASCRSVRSLTTHRCASRDHGALLSGKVPSVCSLHENPFICYRA